MYALWRESFTLAGVFLSRSSTHSGRFAENVAPRRVDTHSHILQYIAVCCGLLLWVAVCYSVLYCVASYSVAPRHDAAYCHTYILQVALIPHHHTRTAGLCDWSLFFTYFAKSILNFTYFEKSVLSILKYRLQSHNLFWKIYFVYFETYFEKIHFVYFENIGAHRTIRRSQRWCVPRGFLVSSPAKCRCLKKKIPNVRWNIIDTWNKLIWSNSSSTLQGGEDS